MLNSTYSQPFWIEKNNDCKCQEGFEDTKEVIRIRKSKKDSQHNGQKK